MRKTSEKGARRFRKTLLCMTAVALLLTAGLILYGWMQRSAKMEAQSADAALPATEPFALREAPELRVFDGELQWYDGARWHTVASVDALRAQDPAAQTDAKTAGEPETAAVLYHNRALGDVPRAGGGGGGSGAGGGGTGGGSHDGEDINPFG